MNVSGSAERPNGLETEDRTGAGMGKIERGLFFMVVEVPAMGPVVVAELVGKALGRNPEPPINADVPALSQGGEEAPRPESA